MNPKRQLKQQRHLNIIDNQKTPRYSKHPQLRFTASVFLKITSSLKVKVTQLCPTLWNPLDYTVHEIFRARILEWVDFPFSRGSNPGLPPCRRILYQLSHKRSPRILEWVAYPFSNRSSQSRNQTGLLHCRQILYRLSCEGSPISSLKTIYNFKIFNRNK